MGSATTQGRPAARDSAAGHVAFRSGDGVGALIANFRSSIPSPSFPLFTLHRTLRSAHCKTRGQADRYSFLVRLFHPQLHAGSSRRTTTFFSRHGLRSWWSSRTRTVSLPTRGTSRRFTASSATSRTVHRARPSGGSLQTMAMMRCLWLSSSNAAAPGRSFSYSARSRPPSRQRCPTFRIACGRQRNSGRNARRADALAGLQER